MPKYYDMHDTIVLHNGREIFADHVKDQALSIVNRLQEIMPNTFFLERIVNRLNGLQCDILLTISDVDDAIVRAKNNTFLKKYFSDIGMSYRFNEQMLELSYELYRK